MAYSDNASSLGRQMSFIILTCWLLPMVRQQVRMIKDICRPRELSLSEYAMGHLHVFF